MIFSNAVILTAGISLNEFEFPPHSGVNVVSDNGGPLSVGFSVPIFSVGGYFTYAERLTITGFDASNAQVVSATSAFSNNEALSGVPGSSANDFIQLNFPGGIAKVTIMGDPAGGSFALDALTTNVATVPEPSTLWLFAAFSVLVIMSKAVHKRGKGL